MESDWARSRMAREQNNMVGATPGGGGTSGVRYKSIESGWRHWGEEWGPRVRGVKDDVPTFVKNLLQDNRKVKGAVDQRGRYNSLKRPSGDPRWPVVVPQMIQSVRKRLPIWLKSGC